MTTQWSKYEATAARKHGKPGREIRPQSTTIDIHSHVAIPQAGAFVKPHLDLSTIPLGHFANAETKALSQKQEEDIRARITTGLSGRWSPALTHLRTAHALGRSRDAHSVSPGRASVRARRAGRGRAALDRSQRHAGVVRDLTLRESPEVGEDQDLAIGR